MPAPHGPYPEEELLVSVLMESLLHEARNPLNALSINLEVMVERLRREAPSGLTAAQEKSVRAMRDQILRVNDVLGRFGEFVAPRSEPAGGVDLSALVSRAVEILGHQARRRRVLFRTALQPGVKAYCEDPGALRRRVLEPLAKALSGAQPGGEVVVAVRQEGAMALLKIEGAEGPGNTGEMRLPLE